MTLPQDKEYHCNLIYNVRLPGAQDDSDYTLSIQFVKFLVKELESSKIKCFYYDRDVIPGRSIFDEFFRGVETSIWTIILFTPKLSSSGWEKYCQQSALYEHIVKNSGNKVIPIIVDNGNLPKVFNLNNALSFDESWKEPGTHVDELRKLKRTILPDEAQRVLVFPTLLDPGTTQDISNGAKPVTQAQLDIDINLNSHNDQPKIDSYAEVPDTARSTGQTATGASACHCEASNQSPSMSGAAPSINADATSHVSNRELLETNNLAISPEAISGHNQSSEALRYENGSQFSPSPDEISSTSLLNSLSCDPDLSCDSTTPKKREIHTNVSDEGGVNQTEQSDLGHQEENITHEWDAGKYQVETFDDGIDGEDKLTQEDDGQPGILGTAKNQDREEQVRGERPRPDGCATDGTDPCSNDPNSTSHPGRWNSAKIVGGAILKLFINGFTRTDSFYEL